MSKYGSKRDSFADLDDELYDIMNSLSNSVKSSNGDIAVPASSLVDVFRIFGEHHDGVQLLTKEEETMLDEFVASNPGLEVTPSVLLNFLAVLTNKGNKTPSSQGSPDNSMQTVEDELVVEDDDDTGNMENASMRPPSRSSSQDGSKASSNLLDVLSAGNTSISSVASDSVFDSGRRRRTAPLNAAPSSWGFRKRTMPMHRRRSDAGSTLSDSEQTPCRSRAGSRSRPPSMPASPRIASGELWNGTMSPPRRPSSRARSHVGIPDGMMSPPEWTRFDRGTDGAFDRPSRRTSNPSSDNESDDEDFGLILDRGLTMSRAEIEAQEREDLLRRANEELQRQIAEQDRILQNKISEHEAELEALQNALEETKSELSMSKREEKELRSKELRYIQQIAALESDVAKAQKALEISRQTYMNLHKQYQEQCTESENLRNSLRTRDLQYNEQVEKISLHSIEVSKYMHQQEHLELHVARLEAQLLAAQETQAQLDEQKQENLLLKETIDRMRFDMDELRNKADGGLSSSTSRASKVDNLDNTLGVELARVNKGKWPDNGLSEDEDESTTAVSDNSRSSGTESEDVVQTIITRRKMRITSRSMKKESAIVEETKIFSDAYTQYEVSEFVSSSVAQTDPEPGKSLVMAGNQTDSATFESTSVQTEPEVIRPSIMMSEMEVQTDPSSPRMENAIASSSSMRDLPPSYAESSKVKEDQERDIHVAAEAVRKWHKGLEVPLLPLQGGVSEDALEEWAALKAEIGIECLAIDKVLEMSLKTGQPRHLSCPSTSAGSSGETSSEDSSDKSPSPRRHRSRFYNIYNTFVYGDADGVRDRERSRTTGLSQAALVLGVFVLAAGMLSGPSVQQQYHVPGGPTYYDRAAWSEFNRLYPVGEGFPLDGAASVWDFIGRVGGEAARMARGWPS